MLTLTSIRDETEGMMMLEWRRGWEDTCTAAGMSREEATKWIDRHLSILRKWEYWKAGFPIEHQTVSVTNGQS